MPTAISPKQAAASLTEHWSPRVIGEVDEDGAVDLDEGDLYVVPKGVRHNPVAEEECHLMLFERKSTLHTGDAVTEKTRSLEEQLRPL